MSPLSRLLMVTTAVLVGSAAAPAQEHSHGTRGSAAPMDTTREAADWIDVTVDADAKELIFTIGPIDLPANAGHHAVENPPLVTAEIPIDAFLYGFDVEMVDADGNPITQRVLHHVNLIDPDRRELFSPVALRLFAAGSETQPASMPKVLGVPVRQGSRMLISAMFHNPTSRSYPGARLRVILKYRGEGWVFPIEVYPIYIDVMGHVGEKDFDLPPGSSQVTWEGSPAVAGRLLAAGGHLHDLAVELRFEDVTAGKMLWQTPPVVDEQGRTVAVPVGKFWWKGGIKLSPDHTYRLTVVYENPTGATIRDGGMGVLGGVFKPSGAWPELDPSDPAYVLNLEKTRETAQRRSHGMAGHEDEDHGH